MALLTSKQNRVLDVIRAATKEKPISAALIAIEADLKDPERHTGVNLRLIVNALRDKGYPICANGKGYYYPHLPSELQEYISSFQERIDSQQEACDALKEKLENWKRQPFGLGPKPDEQKTLFKLPPII